MPRIPILEEILAGPGFQERARQYIDGMLGRRNILQRIQRAAFEQQQLDTARALGAFELVECNTCGAYFPAYQHKVEHRTRGLYVHPYCLNYCEDCRPESEFAKRRAETEPAGTFYQAGIQHVYGVHLTRPLMMDVIAEDESFANNTNAT